MIQVIMKITKIIKYSFFKIDQKEIIAQLKFPLDIKSLKQKYGKSNKSKLINL